MSVCFFKSKHNQSVVFCKLFLQKKKDSFNKKIQLLREECKFAISMNITLKGKNSE